MFFFVFDQKLKRIEFNAEVDKVVEGTSIFFFWGNRIAPRKAVDIKPALSCKTNKLNNDMVKRDELFEKRTKEPTEAKKKGFAKVRNKITEHVQEAKRESNFEKFGNNSSSKTKYSSLKTFKDKKMPKYKRFSFKVLKNFSRNLVQHSLKKSMVNFFEPNSSKI